MALSASKSKKKSENSSMIYEEDEEEIKSSKDHDSRKIKFSNKTIEKIDLKIYEERKRIKVFRTSSIHKPRSSKYSKMLHFQNLKKMSKKLNELKELHKNYFLINYFNSSHVSHF